MKIVATLVAVALLATPSLGKTIDKASPKLYQAGDAYKMHFPQLPDPNGWDVAFPPLIPTVLQGTLGDDWLCTETGPVHDIHLWVSFRGDLVPNLEDQGLVGGTIQIWSNVPADPDAVSFSHPGEPLWTMFFDTSMPNVRIDPDGTGEQGWLEPPTVAARPDHNQIYQISLVTDDSFTQTAGEIYWLTANLLATDPAAPGVEEVGWKTSLNHFQDAAVYYNPLSAVGWSPLADLPPGMAPLDLAFVITPVPEPATVVLMMLGVIAVLATSRSRWPR
jgi:hypothetical protein